MLYSIFQLKLYLFSKKNEINCLMSAPAAFDLQTWHNRFGYPFSEHSAWLVMMCLCQHYITSSFLDNQNDAQIHIFFLITAYYYYFFFLCFKTYLPCLNYVRHFIWEKWKVNSIVSKKWYFLFFFSTTVGVKMTKMKSIFRL